MLGTMLGVVPARPRGGATRASFMGRSRLGTSRRRCAVLGAAPSLAAVLSMSLLASPARAADIGEEGAPLSVEVHGFASQGFVFTTSNNYIDATSEHGSAQFSEVGVNFTKTLVDRLRFGVQLFAQNVGPTGNYNIKADWFYLDYRWRDWLGLRAGRVKIPFGLYNEVNDVDSGRVPILLPQSVYPIDNRNYLLAQTGGELYGYVKLGQAGALDYRGYGGTIYLPTTNTAGSPYTIVGFNVPFLVGGRLLWETPLEGLRAGGSVQALRIDAQLVAQGMPLSVEIPAVLWVASVEYAAHDLLLAAEYSRWYLKSDSSNAMLFPSTKETSERAYFMAGYRATKWLQPGAYYSLLFPDVDHRGGSGMPGDDGREAVQHDIAATLRFDITANWLLKLEGHYMIGTAALNPALNGNTPLTRLDRYWGALLANTTVYF